MRKIVKKFIKSAMYVFIFLIFACVGCTQEDIQNTNDNMIKWYTGIVDITTKENFPANVGDYYLRTTDFSVYCLTDTGWESVGYLINDNSDQFIEGKDGEDGVTISDIKYNYEYDASDNRYLVTTIFFTDGRDPVTTKSKIPMIVDSVRYNGDVVFYVGKADRPTISVKYKGGKKITIDVTENMYIVDDNCVVPNFTKGGFYRVKIQYADTIINEMFEVVKAELTTTEVMAGSGDEHGISIKIYNEDGTEQVVKVTEDMFVVEGKFVMPDFDTPEHYGQYLTKIVYGDYVFIEKITVMN